MYTHTNSQFVLVFHIVLCDQRVFTWVLCVQRVERKGKIDWEEPIYTPWLAIQYITVCEKGSFLFLLLLLHPAPLVTMINVSVTSLFPFVYSCIKCHNDPRIGLSSLTRRLLKHTHLIPLWLIRCLFSFPFLSSRFLCSFCQMTWLTKAVLTHHLLMYSIHCNLCLLSYSRVSSLCASVNISICSRPRSPRAICLSLTDCLQFHLHASLVHCCPSWKMKRREKWKGKVHSFNDSFTFLLPVICHPIKRKRKVLANHRTHKEEEEEGEEGYSHLGRVRRKEEKKKRKEKANKWTWSGKRIQFFNE